MSVRNLLEINGFQNFTDILGLCKIESRECIILNKSILFIFLIKEYIDESNKIKSL